MSSGQDDWSLYINGIEDLFNESDGMLRELPTTTGEGRQTSINQLQEHLNDISRMV